MVHTVGRIERYGIPRGCGGMTSMRRPGQYGSPIWIDRNGEALVVGVYVRGYGRHSHAVGPALEHCNGISPRDQASAHLATHGSVRLAGLKNGNGRAGSAPDTSGIGTPATAGGVRLGPAPDCDGLPDPPGSPVSRSVALPTAGVGSDCPADVLTSVGRGRTP